ncbi:MAG: hypothetical protein HKN69_02920, partial [Desulfofustis sp.]|nr:hypothetical protein [Desulfofustis sp.]
MESIGAEITHTYGLTEVFGPHSVCAWQPAREHLGEEEPVKVKSRQGVAVIPFPDDKWGEVAKAFVVPKPGSEPSAEDIIEFTKSH